MAGPYDDIIDFPYHGSKDHQKMSMNDRAGQFSPFDALFDNDDLLNLADSFNRAEEAQTPTGE